MSQVRPQRNRRLLFRSYVTLAGGLLVIAFVLDFGFGQLQSREQSSVNRWLESTVQIIERSLADIPAGDREALARTLGDQIGVPVTLLARDDIHVNDLAEHQLAPLVDSRGDVSYLHDAASIDRVIRLGPITEPEQSLLLKLLPPLFYLSILVLVGLWLRPLLRDINVISNAAQRFAADYREPLSTADSTSELRPLAGNLDEMAARLSGLLRSQKELIAALSHEMRTPLARLRFALAVAGEKADATLSGKLGAMVDDVQEIDDLVASMLSYARLDHPDIRMHWQQVPAAPWLEKTAGKATSDAARISSSVEDGLDSVWMDARLMELALSNLLFNALKYARQSVHCSLSVISGNYVLSVDDDGPGIPEESREEVFRAFSRLDDSRSRDTGGSGLGLAIVARVAGLHGGAARADASPELGGARITISWPYRDS